ncbi:hypothetical protein COU12_01005 [Candidatus Jorgensenbacteria bacterium CG10_big_fil_rev_8_21_14_0_10_54_38]|uniref:Uncharacterized protein n=2 Tax=Candidatus Joergenseniibacteriota TaxID=1752739 RepID=A0A2M6WGE7_9BACT|nr:MAG: hypothetical protein COX26_00235 [Candidatus Jorgensenbacteria bacterium CG23_combo_of_CG06-09_8_20_14_all_54_14]PIT91846.1 MAG: hypothetical protein COU12_01005 [Candidatus Jorgensenbacteria bacterium CG10_big_fil_rev_8_21_14_0_10_54_38]
MKKVFSFLRVGPLRFSSQSVFLILAVVMTVVVAVCIIYASFLLVSRVNVAVTVEQASRPAVRFDIEGFKKLQLTK